MSAPAGVELIFTVVTSEEIELDGGKTVADVENFAGSRGVSPAMYAVISVPLGIVMSLPCMKRKKGAAGKKTILVATIAPVIPPVWFPPLPPLTARSGTLSPETN